MELCSVSALAKDICHGVVKSAFLMLVKPASPVAALEVDTKAGDTNREDGSV